MKAPILVWRFYEAPEEFQALSQHGGDEDWLAHVPARFYAKQGNDYIPWLEYGSFGVCDISEHRLEDGSRVFIGAHA
jgi:phosphoserine aminotransferase